ncbi:MAG: hypothetical protein A6F70_01480 [Cycloclasticus sp. symbiont of Bathymodiolus heckerae]|nr:MAG: hypothetical protein A6F70_01480 [Cycloclasticus sp. symbiont of Bathymodiolus heckerae]
MSKARLFGHSFLWIFTVSIVVLAVLLVVARFLVLQAPTYKADLEGLLSEEIGSQLYIGDVSASIVGFEPQVSLTNLTLGDGVSHADALSIGEIRLSFDPLGFLVGKINPNKITLVDTRISVRRFADGHLSIGGLSAKQSEENAPSDFSWLLEDGKFEVIESQITWQDDMRDLPDLILNKAHIVFQNESQEHILKMRASLPKDTGGSFVFSIRVKGDVLSSADWSADGYLKAKEINVAKYLPRLKIDELSVNQGIADIELWSTWGDAQLAQVRGNVLVHEAALIQSEKEFNVTNLSAQFDWQSIDNGWNLQAQNFSFSSGEIKQESSTFGLQYQEKEDGIYSLQASANGISLEAASNVLLHSAVLDEQVISMLENLKVSGSLNKAHMSINVHEEKLLWGACGELKNLSNAPLEKLPQVETVSATWCSTQDSGWVNLDTDKGSVYFKNLFRYPIVINKLEGVLTWVRESDGWLINSDHIRLNSPHITSQTRVNIQLPFDGESPVIDLQSNFGRAEGRFTPLYLPVGIMGDGLVNWLDNAFIEGEIKSCGLVLKGALSDFPYRQKKGAFQVLFGTENVLLHYADNWPDVLGASADVEFKNEGMNIIGYKGRISGNEIKHVQVGIADFEANQYLSLKGEIEDDIEGLYTFFQQSPLKERVTSLLDHSAVSGPAVVDLDVEIPLEKGLETKVNAEVLLKEGRIAFPRLDLDINHIQGAIYYDEKGLRGKSLIGRVLGQRIDVDIYPEKDSTIILAESRLDVASIASKYPSDFWKKLQGSSAANLKVSLPHSGLTGGGSSTITLKSNLDGIAVDLPKPIGKAKRNALPLDVMVKLGGNTLPIKATYGDVLKSSLRFSENKSKRLELKKADIHLGPGESYLPIKEGVQLSGKIDLLDVEAWIKALNLGQASSAKSPPINQFNVNIASLKWRDSTFDNIHLIGRYKKPFWEGEVNSPIVLGRYKVPSNLEDNEISLDLETLTLPSHEDLNLDDNQSPLSPSDIPNIDINSKELLIGQTKLGALELKLRQKDNGMIIKSLSVKSARDEFLAAGAWEIKEDRNRTALSGSLRSKSLGSLLKDTGVTPKLKDAPVDVYFDLHWPGEPQAFSKDHLNGYLNIQSEQGRLLDVEPGIGRVFGLLSLNTLQRRLQLDFSDLVQKGLSFDKIKGRFVITDGEAQTNRFYLESPSARLDFQGRIGLAKEDVSQLITVTPNTTESLPVASALAGGPLVGAAVFIVQKIAGETVNKLAGYQYRVTGPWVNPKIKQISQPGGKIFGIVDNVLGPVFDATIGKLPLEKVIPEFPIGE